MHSPLFWRTKNRLSSALLPLACLYGFFAKRRRNAGIPETVSAPVVCIGNAVVGGAGKTPVALALGEMLKAQGIRAHMLSRGYKGSEQGPLQVDAHRHTAAQVGDEPLLLAQLLPTWVAKDRVQGAKAAIEAGAQRIVMDDGYQNPALHKDVSLLVIDGAYGFGNGRLLPAGPLREPVAEAMARASAVVLIGEDETGVLDAVPPHLPVLRARIETLPQAQQLKGQAVLAFAGIARPYKFHRTLQELGCDVRKMVAYPDHHAFTPGDLAFLQAKAAELQARLVTTHKDYVRLPESMRAEVTYVPIAARFDDAPALMRIVLQER